LEGLVAVVTVNYIVCVGKAVKYAEFFSLGFAAVYISLVCAIEGWTKCDKHWQGSSNKFSSDKSKRPPNDGPLGSSGAFSLQTKIKKRTLSV
jgi:hypothetical protein